jgi:hypothetical protein
MRYKYHLNVCGLDVCVGFVFRALRAPFGFGAAVPHARATEGDNSHLRDPCVCLFAHNRVDMQAN